MTERASAAAPVKPSKWTAIDLPQEIDGAGFLKAFAAWKRRHNIGGLGASHKKGRGLLHSNKARDVLCGACYSVDAPHQLLVDILMVADLGAPEVLQLVHAVIGALTCNAASGAHASIQDESKKSTYIGEIRDLRASVMKRTVESFLVVLKTLSSDGTTVSAGLCRLPLKAWGLLCGVEGSSVEATEAAQKACSVALQCITVALTKLSERAGDDDRECDHEMAVVSRRASLGIATELLVMLGHRFVVDDAKELIHWLVQGAEWAAHLER